MDTKAPLASIIMPCYNHALFISESVAAILQQTIADFELIVVDDASKDDSVLVIRELTRQDSRVKLIAHEKNRGASASRNDGIRAARGAFVAFCDADDLWMPDKLEKQIALLNQHPECDVTYCAAEIIDEKGQPTGDLFSLEFPVPAVPTGDLFEVLSERNFINMQTVLVRRAAVESRLIFDENIKWVEDWWLWIQLSRHHRFAYSPSIMAQYRVHPRSTGKTQKAGIRFNRWKVCKRNIRLHPDLPVHLQSRLWYMMGNELSQMGRSRLARRFFGHALCLGLHERNSLRISVTTFVSYFLEFFPKRISKLR